MVGLLGNEKTPKKETGMKKPIYPTPLGWSWLNQSPIKCGRSDDIAAGTIILSVAFAVFALAAITYDQVRDARWNAERQAICDSRGC